MPLWVHDYLPVFTAVGLGSIAAAIIAAFISRELTIAQLRQAWINGIRDDIAEYIASIIAQRTVQILVRSRTRRGEYASSDDDGRLLEHETKTSVTLSRIKMRLNPKEGQHNQLIVTCERILGRDIDEPIDQYIDNIIHCSQIMLKREWQVTKWSFMSPTVNFLKQDVFGRLPGRRVRQP